MVRERGGTPFRQIFWSRNGAPANIVGHRWNANTEAFRQITPYSLGWPSISLFSGPNCRQTRDLASKISKEISGGDTPGPPEREGATPSRTYTQHGYTPCAGAQALPLLGPRSRKPFLQVKIYHYTHVCMSVRVHISRSRCCDSVKYVCNLLPILWMTTSSSKLRLRHKNWRRLNRHQERSYHMNRSSRTMRPSSLCLQPISMKEVDETWRWAVRMTKSINAPCNWVD